MSDTLSWGAKWEAFSKWVEKANSEELKKWINDIPVSRQWAYKEEICCVKNELKKRRSKPAPQDVALKSVRDKMREAGKYSLRASHLVEKSKQCLIEATRLCPHPPDKVIQWYYLNYEQACCSFYQCTQCGLRDTRGYDSVFKRVEGTDYHKVSSIAPDEARDTYTRTATEEDRKLARKK